MRWLAALLSTVVSLGAVQASEPPLEAWLEVAKTSPRVIFAPRLGSALRPVADALSRLKGHPAIGRLAQGPQDAVDALFGMRVFDIDDHASRGLDLDGPLFLAGGVTIVGFKSSGQVEHYLGHALGLELSEGRVCGREGWRSDGGVALWADGLLYLARTERELLPFLDPAPASSISQTLADCPMGPGEADLWFIERAISFGLGRGCATVRFDRDRVRVSGRLVTPVAQLLRKYLDPEADLGPVFNRLGSDISAAVVAQLGPKSRDRVLITLARRKSSPGARRLANTWNGLVGAAGGPRLGEMTVVVGVDDSERARRALAMLLADASPQPETLGPGRWRLQIPIPKDWPKSLPKTDRIEFGVNDGAVYASTRPPAGRSVIGDLRTVDRRARMRMDVFEKASLALYYRAAGKPGDGRDWADAMLVAVKDFGADPQLVKDVASAAAYLLGHFSELGVGVRPTRTGLRVEFEMVIL